MPLARVSPLCYPLRNEKSSSPAAQTESNNLALKGVVARSMARADRQQPPHIVSVTSEHKALLDPLTRLGRDGVSITLVNPRPKETLEPDLSMWKKSPTP